MEKTTKHQGYLLAALENGTVIDHIPCGQGMPIVKLLRLEATATRFVIGCNLDSPRLGAKDIIKIYDRFLSEDEANQVAVFAPEATISIVQSGEVDRKFQVVMPDEISGVLRCPNPRCISRSDEQQSRFRVRSSRAHSLLTCHFCEAQFTLNEQGKTLLGEADDSDKAR